MGDVTLLDRPAGPTPADPAQGVDWDADQQLAIDRAARGRGAVVVVGGPGTGKTRVLIESIAARVAAGAPLESFVVLTQSRPQAQTLRRELLARIGRTQRLPQIGTIHGWALSLMRSLDGDFEQSGVRLLTSPEQDFRIRELLQAGAGGPWPAELLPSLCTGRMAQEMRTLMSLVRGRGQDPGQLVEQGLARDESRWVAAGSFHSDYLDVLDAEHTLDYAELLHRVRLLLRDQPTAELLASRVTAVYCDEFAELEAGQLALLSDVHQLGVPVVVMADPDTAVYRFRGAQPGALRRVDEWFTPGPGREVVRVDLRTNHRNPGPVAEVVGRLAARLPNFGQQPSTPARPQGGRVEFRVLPSRGAETREVAGLLASAHLDEQLPWSQMAVICRGGAEDLHRLGRDLGEAGVPVQLVGARPGLAEDPGVRALCAALRMAADWAEQPPDPGAVRELLTSPLGGCTEHEVRDILRQLMAPQAGQLPGPRPDPEVLLVDALRSGPGVQAGSSPVLAPLWRLHRLLSEAADRISAGRPVAESLWRVWSVEGGGWPTRLRTRAVRGGPDGVAANRTLDAVIALFDVAAEISRPEGLIGVRALLAAVAAQQVPEDTARESDARETGVTLISSYRVKGRQWPLVVVCGLTEGSWPRRAVPGSLLHLDRLDGEGAGEPGTRRELLATERRALLLACSRSTDRLVLTAGLGSLADPAEPSPFLSELGWQQPEADDEGVPVQEAEQLPARTLRQLVGELRQASTDPGQPLAVRGHAAALLARVAGLRDERGRPLVAEADPRTWWSVDAGSPNPRPVAPPGEPIRLTGSHLEDLLTCPRRWFLVDRLGSREGDTLAMRAGTLVHELAAHAQREGVELDSLRPVLRAAWPSLAHPMQWRADHLLADFDAATGRLSRWLSGRTNRLLGVEVPFQVQVSVDDEQVLLRGTVDRLELDDQDRLVIVDFKTGRTAPDKVKLACHPQLGVYQLAALTGAFQDLAPQARGVAGAVLVFPRVEQAGSGACRERVQASLAEVAHQVQDPSSGGQPTWVHQLLSEAVRILRSEQFPAVAQVLCRSCPVRYGCPANRLLEGDRP